MGNNATTTKLEEMHAACEQDEDYLLYGKFYSKEEGNWWNSWIPRFFELSEDLLLIKSFEGDIIDRFDLTTTDIGFHPDIPIPSSNNSWTIQIGSSTRKWRPYGALKDWTDFYHMTLDLGEALDAIAHKKKLPAENASMARGWGGAKMKREKAAEDELNRTIRISYDVTYDPRKLIAGLEEFGPLESGDMINAGKPENGFPSYGKSGMTYGFVTYRHIQDAKKVLKEQESISTRRFCEVFNITDREKPSPQPILALGESIIVEPATNFLNRRGWTAEMFYERMAYEDDTSCSVIIVLIAIDRFDLILEKMKGRTYASILI